MILFNNVILEVVGGVLWHDNSGGGFEIIYYLKRLTKTQNINENNNLI